MFESDEVRGSDALACRGGRRSPDVVPVVDADEHGSWLDSLVAPELGPVAWLAEMPPSGRLLSDLESLPPDLVDDDYDAVEVVAHWHRLEAYCAAQKRFAAAAAARRQTLSRALVGLDRHGVTVNEPNITGDELALRLGVTKRAAQRLVSSGRAMAGVGIPTGEALASGHIDAVKADAIVDALEDLGADEALEVQERVLGVAGHLPAGRVRRELASACAEVEPASFEQRCEAATKHRHVDHPRVLPHGMASLYAVLPAVAAGRLYRAVDAAARSAAATGDARTMDQLRADAFAMLGADAIERGWIGPCPDRQAELSSRGAARTPEGGPRTSGEPSGEPRSAPADVERRTPPSGAAGMRVGQIGGRSAQVRVVVPLSAAMGGHDGPGTDLPGADAPAELEGYGPIPGSVARAVAAGGEWQRMVVDPVSGAVHELSTTSYRPTAAISERVRAVQSRCVRPGCGVGADSCDLNHRIPWPAGATAVENLDPLCRRDHLLITHAGWEYQQAADRSRTWSTSTGHVYAENPDGAITMAPRRSPPPRRVNAPDAGDPPPY